LNFGLVKTPLSAWTWLGDVMVVVRAAIPNDEPAALANIGDCTRLVCPGSEPEANRPDTTA
jgi:hypothetical protein